MILNALLKIMNRSFNILSLRPELVGLLLLVLKLALRGTQRFRDFGKLLFSLGKLGPLDDRFFLGSGNVLAIAFEQAGCFLDSLEIEFDPTGGRIEFIFKLLDTLASIGNLFFKHADIVTLLAEAKLLRFNLLLERTLGLAQAFDFPL